MSFKPTDDSEIIKLKVKKVFTAYKTASEYNELRNKSSPHSPLAWAASWYKNQCKTQVAINYFGNFSSARLLDFQANEEIIDFWVYMSS